MSLACAAASSSSEESKRFIVAACLDLPTVRLLSPATAFPLPSAFIVGLLREDVVDRFGGPFLVSEAVRSAGSLAMIISDEEDRERRSLEGTVKEVAVLQVLAEGPARPAGTAARCLAARAAT